MNAKKSKRARSLIRDVIAQKRAMTQDEEKLVRKYSKSHKVSPDKVIAFLRSQHKKTEACGDCSCHPNDTSLST